MAKIAAQHNTSFKLICDYNVNVMPSHNCSLLEAGQQLRIPPTCVEEPGVWGCQTFGSLTGHAFFSHVINDYNYYLTTSTSYSRVLYVDEHTNVRVPLINQQRTATMSAYPCTPGPVIEVDEYSRKTVDIYHSWDCHQVQKGETMKSISDMYHAYVGSGTGMDDFDLYNANQPIGEESLQVGMQLRVFRGCLNEPGQSYCYRVHTNETLTQIGKAHGVPEPKLCQYNQLADCSLIWDGKWMKIPVLYPHENTQNGHTR